MSDLPYKLARRFLFALDPEAAHRLALETLGHAEALGFGAITAKLAGNRIPGDPRIVMGLVFPNPVGLAAGLDKDGACIDALSRLGFGFLEIGTVTPRAQPGNPKPRMFRLPSAYALINRMGFNNGGLERFLTNIEMAKLDAGGARPGGARPILGLNLGKNADTPIERAVDDYLVGLRAVYDALPAGKSYVTINVSSPNTKNLRQLQGASELDGLLGAIKTEQARLADLHGHYVPIALKIAPDLDGDQIRNVADALLRHRFDGVIATNTTLAREPVRGIEHASETGGLSGAPLLEASNSVVRALRRELRGEVPIIGVGGILSGADARAKIEAGADLVQLYTGLIYRGPALVAECAAALRR